MAESWASISFGSFSMRRIARRPSAGLRIADPVASGRRQFLPPTSMVRMVTGRPFMGSMIDRWRIARPTRQIGRFMRELGPQQARSRRWPSPRFQHRAGARYWPSPRSGSRRRRRRYPRPCQLAVQALLAWPSPSVIGQGRFAPGLIRTMPASPSTMRMSPALTVAVDLGRTQHGGQSHGAGHDRRVAIGATKCCDEPSDPLRLHQSRVCRA